MICVIEIVIIVGETLAKAVSHRAGFEEKKASTMSGPEKRAKLDPEAGPSSGRKSPSSPQPPQPPPAFPRIFMLNEAAYHALFE